MVMWGGIGLIVQLLVYLAARRVLPDLAQRIREGNLAHGIFLGALSLAGGDIKRRVHGVLNPRN